MRAFPASLLMPRNVSPDAKILCRADKCYFCGQIGHWKNQCPEFASTRLQSAWRGAMTRRELHTKKIAESKAAQSVASIVGGKSMVAKMLEQLPEHERVRPGSRERPKSEPEPEPEPNCPPVLDEAAPAGADAALARLRQPTAA